MPTSTLSLRVRPASFESAVFYRAPPLRYEQVIAIAFLFINQFGTPSNWFRINTGFGSAEGSNPLLVGGSLLLMLMMLPSLVGRGDQLIAALRDAPYLWVFLGVVTLSYTWSTVPTSTMVDTVNLLVLSVFGLVLAIRFTVRDFMAVFAITMVIGLLLSFAWVVALPQYGRTNAGWSGLGVGKNDLGNDGLFGVAILFLAARLFPRWRFPLYFTGLIALVLLIGSLSKTSLAAGVLTLIAVLVFQAFRARRTLYGAVILTLSLTALVAFLFATANIGLLARWLDKDITLSGRTDMWPLIVDSIKSRPILGHGYGGYWNGFFSPAFGVLIENTWEPNHAHNALLEIALELGLVGLALFLVINVRSIGRAIRFIQRTPGPTGLFPLCFLTIGVMVSITESGLIEQRAGWAIFVFVVLSVGRRDQGMALR